MLSLSDTPTPPAAPDSVKDVNIDTFMVDVIEASRQTPVIVDFWAPWCGPCKQLGPALEKLVRAQGGAIKLAKIDIDKNPEIAQQMRVQSIPAVFVFHQGQPVDGFMGALPDSQLKSWIEKLMKTLNVTGAGASDADRIKEALAEADAMLAADQTVQAALLFEQIMAADPENADAFAGRLRCMIRTGHFAEARDLMASAAATIAKAPVFQAAVTALELAEAGLKAAAGRTTAEANLAKNPNDHQARFDLALALFAANDKEAAIDALIEIVSRQRNWNDDAARKQLLKFFEALGPTDPLTLAGRRRLSSVLFA